MAGHHHHEHSGEKLVSEAESVLTAAGEQWTQMRADVFEALADQERPASAYDIAEELGRRRGKRVAACATSAPDSGSLRGETSLTNCSEQDHLPFIDTPDLPV